MSKQNNVYDLVERTAARHGLPRLELWQKVVRDLLSGKLPALNLDSGVAHTTWRNWLIGFQPALDRQSDPNRVARFLKQIMVLETEFEKWLRNAVGGEPGPVVGTTSYIASDRELFSAISDLSNSGKARSPDDAALMLVKDKKVATSKRKRGPQAGTTGYVASDRELFPAMTEFATSGKARSLRDAALMLVKDNKVAGTGDPENKAKRLCARYRQEVKAPTTKLPETS
jgi:hypothetical protein